MKNIKSVRGLRIGDKFTNRGVNYIVTSFPTRYSVCGRNAKPQSGEPGNCKVPLSQCNWIHYLKGGYDK